MEALASLHHVLPPDRRPRLHPQRLVALHGATPRSVWASDVTSGDPEKGHDFHERLEVSPALSQQRGCGRRFG